MKFEDLKLDTRLLDSLKQLGLNKPTPIQEKAIPFALTRRDVIGIAPTGSGKTLAYVLPVLDWVYNSKVDHNDPTVLMLVPTRELVKQLYQVIREVTQNTDVRVAQIYSGPREGKQKRVFKDEFIDIVIATPGRLLNFLEDKVLNLRNIGILVMDEVDRLLDMSFLPDVMKIIQYLPPSNARHTLVFGSSLKPQEEQLCKDIMKNPKIVDLGRSKPPSTITHEIYEVYEDSKFDTLLQILRNEDIDKVIIFLQSQHQARITARNLIREGLELEEIHAGLTQRQREKAIENFRTGEVTALIASDVASRGLDIPYVTHVINFDVPSEFSHYLHRAGRTGRAYEKGVSIILASPKEFSNLANIEKRLKGKVIKKKTLKPKKKRKAVMSSESQRKFLKSSKRYNKFRKG